MKFKKPTQSQVILALLSMVVISVIVSMFLTTIKTALGLSTLAFIVFCGYKLYKSTPQQRIQWGKKYKLLSFIFKEESQSKT